MHARASKLLLSAAAMLATLGSAGPALAQQWGSDPNSLVYTLYAQYGEGGEGMAGDIAAFLTPETRAMLERATADDGEAAMLEADPFCDCQDWTRIEVRAVLLTMESDDRARAAAHIADAADPGRPRDIVFDLRRTPQGWRIHDAGPQDGWTLRGALEPAQSPESTGDSDEQQ